MADSGLAFTVDGKRYELNLDEITGRDAKAFRDTTGMSFRRAVTMFVESPADVDLDTIAGIIWLARRQGGEQVAYDDVLGAITYTSNFSAERAEVDPPEV